MLLLVQSVYLRIAYKSFKMSTETETINLALLPKTTPSLCIPRVFKNITRERVISTINELGIGSITRVDMVPSGVGDKFQRVFIHIEWNSGDVASRARTRLLAGKEIKIIYDEPWFWKVSANRATNKTRTRPAHNGSAGPSLVFDSDSDDATKPRPRPRQEQRSRPRSTQEKPETLVDEYGRDISMRKAQEPQEELTQEQEPSVDEVSFTGHSCSVLDVDKPCEDVCVKLDYGEIPALPLVKRKRILKKPQ
jgi:hypothetical protein